MSRQVHEALLNCVCFLGLVHDERTFSLIGTAFWVGDRAGEGGDRVFLVTARHTIDKATNSSGKLAVRLNLNSGGSSWLQLPPLSQNWVLPADPGVDLALLGGIPSTEEFAYAVIPAGWLATDEMLEEENVGLGDEVRVPSLLRDRGGRIRNLPVIRSGLISSMFDETLQDPDSGHPYSAFLVELRSISGVSGSPVFIYYKPADQKTMLEERVGDKTPRVRLLGAIRGHYQLHARGEAWDEERQARDKLNTGMAIVTPAREIRALLDTALARR